MQPFFATKHTFPEARESVAMRWPLAGKIGAGLAIVACLLCINQFPDGPFRTVRDWLFDTYQQIWPAERAGPATVLIEIDNESIRRLGQWPWPRSLLAQLIECAGQASAIGLDILLPEPDRLAPRNIVRELRINAPDVIDLLRILPDPDAVLATTIRSFPIVLATTIDSDSVALEPFPFSAVHERGTGGRPRLTKAKGVRLPLRQLAESARAIGIISAGADKSGKISELPAVAEIDQSLVPGFAVQLLAVAAKQDLITLNTTPVAVSSLGIGPWLIPTSPSGEIRPRFIGPSRLVRISAYRLLGPDADLASLRGRTVVIGVTADGIAETFLTPLGVRESGAAIQVELLDSMIAKDTLWRPIWAGFVETLEALGLTLATVLLFGHIGWRLHIIGCGVLVLLMIGSSVLLFLAYGILLDWTFPLRSLVIASLVGSLVHIYRELNRKRQREAELATANIRRAAAEREAELLSEAARLRQSLDFAVDAARVGVWDADLRQATWLHSPLHDSILGLTAPPASWTNAILLERIVPEELEAARSHLAAAEISGILQLECGIRWQDGSLRYIHVLGRFWRGPDNALSRVAGVVADMTQQRLFERKLRQTEKMQAVGLLASGVAHNFNNLLMVILGSLERAMRRVDASSEAGELIDRANMAARKCGDIARHLLAFARLQPLQPTVVDPASLLRTICQMISQVLPENVRLHLKAPYQLTGIHIDPIEFELALLNVAINARDAMPDGGEIAISACVEQVQDGRQGLNGHYLVVEVVDNGAGIPSEVLPKVCEPFFTTKDVGKGTGLGLSQVHGFAHQSGGALEIKSTLALGTTVRLYLPADARQQAQVLSFGTEMSK